MKNVTAGRLGGFMEETEKCHAELVSASSVRESKFRWTLNQVQGDGLAASTGFTLIELLVVVLIIGILAAIALPKYEVAVAKSRATEALLNLQSLYKAQQLYYMANNTYTDKISELDFSLPVKIEEDREVAQGSVYTIHCTTGFCQTQGIKAAGQTFPNFEVNWTSKRFLCLCGWNNSCQVCKSMGGTYSHNGTGGNSSVEYYTMPL